MGTYDFICIGAGPTGLATAIEAKRAGMRPLVIDKGCLCNSIYHYPVNMVFFTTPELLEIGDLPLVCAAEKPTRVEALKYYRKAAEHYGLELRLYERVLRVDGHDGNFTVVTKTEKGTDGRYSSKKIAVATGYYDLPNELGVPVTLVHRQIDLGATIKYWVRPDIENRIKAGQVKALFETRVKQITKDDAVVENGAGEKRLPARQVFALIGYHPDFAFIEKLGVQLDPESRRPALDPNTLESNVPGIHLAGVVIGGRHTGEIFIENGRFHGKQIIEALRA